MHILTRFSGVYPMPHDKKLRMPSSTGYKVFPYQGQKYYTTDEHTTYLTGEKDIFDREAYTESQPRDMGDGNMLIYRKKSSQYEAAANRLRNAYKQLAEGAPKSASPPRLSNIAARQAPPEDIEWLEDPKNAEDPLVEIYRAAMTNPFTKMAGGRPG